MGLERPGYSPFDGRRDFALLVAGAVGGLVAVDQPHEVGAEAGVFAADHEADGVAGGGAEPIGVSNEVHLAKPSTQRAGVCIRCCLGCECRRCGCVNWGLACAVRVFSKKLLRRGGCIWAPDSGIAARLHRTRSGRGARVGG